MSGVFTNVITAVEVTPSNVGDSTPFPDLVKKTAENFKMKEVSADKAYSSRKNLELVSENGAIPFIPFRSNMTSRPKGCMIWKRMYQYFEWNYDEYMLHYHKRSNAESLFSMLKRKFGNNLRTKTETSRDNEILCKGLCHNIAVLIHAVFELNLNIEFEDCLKGTNFYANNESAQIFRQ